MSFINGFNNMIDITRTENGAIAYESTGNPLLDMFGKIGGMRRSDEKEIIDLYLKARAYDKELADNCILYCRSIRTGGLGERRIGRILLRELAILDPNKILRNLDTIVNCGRWDDLFVFLDTDIKEEVYNFIKEQFFNDYKNFFDPSKISLLVKWMPSINTSSASTRVLAKKFCEHFDLTEKQYRKALSLLRKRIKVVERLMSDRNFEQIIYNTVPSYAMKRYGVSFSKNDYNRFQEYMDKVNEGVEKINSSTLYPYDIVLNIFNNNVTPTLEAQWKALPNYLDQSYNVIAMCDVSGSMLDPDNIPIATSTSLGIYFAEHNTGAYQNYMLTFTDCPKFFYLDPKKSLAEKVDMISKNVGYSTNLDGAIESIYNVSIKEKDAPRALLIISDQEIDYFISFNNYESIVDKWARKFINAELKMPKIIFWNVNARLGHYLSESNNPYVAFVSGSSAATFKELNTLICYDAETAMKMILEKQEFSWK